MAKGQTGGLELVFQGLSVEKGSRQILQDVSGVVHTGEMLAVMGPSGSGKTTLLNCIAGRLAHDSGEVTVNGQPLTSSSGWRVGYVLQGDVFHTSLTLWETIYFAAMIRLPGSLSRKEKIARVNQLIDTFDLETCKNTIMGGPFVRGVSGGEKKRASIACELLSDPDIMLLDEPTSGLDSSTALSLMTELQHCTQECGTATMLAIHQPSSQIFHMFTSLLLLTQGKLAYFGQAKEVLSFFEGADLTCSQHYNPADFILEVVTQDEEAREKVLSLMEARRRADDRWLEKEGRSSAHTPMLEFAMDSLGDQPDQRWNTSLWLQYCMLCWRNFKTSRSRILSKFTIFTCFLISIEMGLIWLQIPRDTDTVRDRQGLLFFLLMVHLSNAFMDPISSLLQERPILLRERAGGWYRVSAYYLAQLTSEMPLTFLLPSISLTLTYWMAGLKGPPEFFASWGILLLSSLASQSVGIAIGSYFTDFQLAYTVALTFFLCTLIAGGFYSQTFPSWLQWLRYLSVVAYPLSAITRLELQDAPPIPCSDLQMRDFPQCENNETQFVTSQMLLEKAGMGLPLYVDVLAIIGFLIVFRFMGYWILRISTNPK